MTEIFKNIKAKIGITLSSLLSALGISGGSASAVCQTTCSTTTGVLPLIGVSLSATPFAFIKQYQFYIWWIAFLFFLLLLWLFINKSLRTKTDKALLFINGGLLLIGTPYLRDRLSEFFILVGLGLFIAGFIMLLSALKRFSVKFEG